MKVTRWLLVIFLGMSCARAASPSGHAGTWASELDGHVFMVLTIAQTGSTFTGSLTRPNAFQTQDFVTFSGFGSGVTVEPIVSAVLDGATLRLVTENPANKTDRTAMALTLAGNDRASLTLVDAGHASLSFARRPSTTKTDVFTGWAPDRSYPSGAAGKPAVVGIVDLFGLRHVSDRTVRDTLGIREGDPLPDPIAKTKAGQRVEALPGVKVATVDLVCCDNGLTVLYVGIQEDGDRDWVFRPAPTGAVRLPAALVEAGRAYDRASQAAVLAGDNREDDSQGHSLSHNPAARAIENAFMAYASRDLPALRAVLRDSNDAGQRALAAQVIAYTPNKAAVVDDLAAAIDDPSDDVRNNAMRALGVMAMATSDGGTLRGMMPVAPFVRLLDSPVWTDRNKAVMTLVSLSERRDPRVLAALRRTALPSLAEMARWKSREHALGAFLLLGRVAHMTDDAIDAAWMQDPETLLRVATKERSR